MAYTLLFPSDYMDPFSVDEDMEKEYDAAEKTSEFDLLIFDCNEWFSNEEIYFTQDPEEEVTAIYRGWMMEPEQYARFYEKLSEKKVRLITTPEQYERFFVYPSIYPLVSEDAAKMRVFPLHEQIFLHDLEQDFEGFMITDYLNALRNTDFPDCFGFGILQEDFDKWMEKFYRYRGDLLYGGICVKEFLYLKKYGMRTNERRVCFFKGQPIIDMPMSKQGDSAERVKTELVTKYSSLPGDFYYLDFVETEEDSWKIIGGGDASTMTFPENADFELFYKSMLNMK